MHSNLVLDDDAIRRRGSAAAEEFRAKLASMTMSYLIAVGCVIGILAAACMEVFSATVGFRAAFPTLSNGTSLADAIMPIAYAIGFYMLLGSVLLSGIIARFGTGIAWLLDGLGLIAIVVMLLAVGLFMFSATFQTVGDGDGQGVFGMLAGFSGPALGIMCASLFTVSFLAAHKLAAMLLKRLEVIAAGRAERATLADLDKAIAAVGDDKRRVETARHGVGELVKPDTLRWKAASEAGRIVGLVAAQAHALWGSQKMMVGVELGPDEVSDIPELPPAGLAQLEQLVADLKQYTTRHFFNLLKKEI